MCGIVGFTGRQQAASILLNGLSKLEYRGYDSAGIAVRDGEHLAQVVCHFLMKEDVVEYQSVHKQGEKKYVR